MARYRSRRMMDQGGELPTLVGEDVRLRGHLGGRGQLVVYGVFEGESEVRGGVVVASGGRWVGTLRGVDVVIAGTVEGDVIADSRMELTPTARITGNLTARALAMADGATIEGSVSITGDVMPRQFKERRGRWWRLGR